MLRIRARCKNSMKVHKSRKLKLTDEVKKKQKKLYNITKR